MSFFLIETSTTPTTGDDIDSDNDGTPDGAVFSGWTVFDSVGIADDETDAGSDTQSICYGSIIFVQDLSPENIALVTQPDATIVETGDLEAHYIGRIGNSSGSGANDWVAAQLSGTAPNFSLATGGTFPAILEGYALDHVGAENFFVCPDGQIGKKSTSLKGNDIYNLTAAGQKITQTTKKRVKLKYFFKLENDGHVDDSISVKGTKGNSKYDVTYRVDGEGNVTAAIIAGTYTKVYTPGQMRTGKLLVKPTRKTERTGRSDLKKTRRTLTMTLSSNIDASEKDKVKAVAKTK